MASSEAWLRTAIEIAIVASRAPEEGVDHPPWSTVFLACALVRLVYALQSEGRLIFDCRKQIVILREALVRVAQSGPAGRPSRQGADFFRHGPLSCRLCRVINKHHIRVPPVGDPTFDTDQNPLHRGASPGLRAKEASNLPGIRWYACLSPSSLFDCFHGSLA
jgi:hypothetical protein